MTTLLVAKNSESVQLLKFIMGLINDGSDIHRKLQAVVKDKKSKDLPVLRLPDGRVITDINQIYFYFGQNIGEAPRRRERQEEMSNEYSNFERYLEDEMDFDGEGRPMRGEKYEDQPTHRRKINGEDDESSEEININKQELVENFMARRGRGPPKMKRGKIVEDEQPKRSKKKKRSRKYESSEESSEQEDVEEFMNRVIKE
jgi:hypothetical protein